MDEINKNISSTIDLEIINACRLHLKVMFLSDITNNQGNCLLNGILSGDKTYLKNSNLQWPNQPSPNKNHGPHGPALSPKSTIKIISQLL